MIIVEGVDGAGKTTLVRELQQTFELAEGERGTKDRKLLYTVTKRDTYSALAAAVKGDETPKVWDRLFFSEFVYASVVGREPEFNSTDRSFVSRVLEAVRPPIIVCLPPIDVVKDNIVKDEQMDGVTDNIDLIYGRYVGLMEGGFPEHTMLYDYTDLSTDYGGSLGRDDFSTLDEIKTEINDYLNERAERTWTL